MLRHRATSTACKKDVLNSKFSCQNDIKKFLILLKPIFTVENFLKISQTEFFTTHKTEQLYQITKLTFDKTPTWTSVGRARLVSRQIVIFKTQ